MSDIAILPAQFSDINEIAVLFNDYRVFYQAESDLPGSTAFLTDRFNNRESTIFYAKIGGQFAGFIQLFPVFSSVSMTRVYILNDLFVAEQFRGKGIATQLIQTAINFAKSEGCSRVSLSTAADNPAQKLYEALGFKLSGFKFYNFSLT